MRITLACTGAQNLALEALAPMLNRGGHQVSIAFDPGLFDDKYFLNIPCLAKVFNQSKSLVRQILSQKPDMVGFSVMTNTYKWALSISKMIKNKQKMPIVFGGIHPSSVPEIVIDNPQVDYVVQGEGDFALLDLANNLQAGGDGNGIDNVRTKQTRGPVPIRNLIHDLNILPQPDKSLFLKHLPVRDLCMVMTSRGCPYCCTYCCHSVLKKVYENKGAYVRRRSVESVVDTCKRMKVDHGVRLFSFVDDVFSLNKAWLSEFRKQYKEKVGLPFFCNIHVRHFSKETAETLKDAGCTRLEFGVQSMNEHTRRHVLNRVTSNDQIENVMSILDEVGLDFQVHHIFGLPGDKEKDYYTAAKFYAQPKRLYKVNCFYLNYFPGTEILEYALKNNLINESHVASFKRGEDPIYYDGGSLGTTENPILGVARNYEKLFTLMPLTPRWFTGWLIDHKKIHWLKFFPGLALLTLESTMAIFRRHKRAQCYMKYYFKKCLLTLAKKSFRKARRLFGMPEFPEAKS